eukprot:3735220-Amphidinium_carterae.1
MFNWAGIAAYISLSFASSATTSLAPTSSNSCDHQRQSPAGAVTSLTLSQFGRNGKCIQALFV